MNLFEIEREIMLCVDMETGEIIDTEKLDQLSMERDTKIENIACWIKNLSAEATALKDQKQAFADRQKTAENKMESLKKYLATYLNGQKFATDKVAVSFRKTSSVNVTDMTLIPEEYLKYAEPTVNKTAVKDAIKSGLIVPGAEIAEGQSISIK
jgi:hypothetical protein